MRLQLRTTNASGVPTQPHVSADSAPIVRVYSTAGLVETARMWLLSYPEETGLYACDLPLDSSYSTGHHSAHATWTTGSGSFRGCEHWQFHIVAGGNASGSVIAMQELDRPGTNYVVAEYDSGVLVQGRGAS